MAQTQQQLYTHAAEPKAVQQRRPKYRDEAEPQAANIMYDKRVVRGNTYAARILAAELGQTADTLRSTGGSPGTSKRKTTTRRDPGSGADPVEGRRHMDIQTDQYLEELTDTVPESEISTQTDAFLDRPPTPLFVPQKTGEDATTQIDAGDLFDFDFEVEPILEVLVGKVLEQGLMEVLEEEELAAMRAHQEHFEQVRNSELVATQRMEAAEKRRVEEKLRRLQQERERAERERMVRAKVAASTFSRGYLSGIVASVFNQLQANGTFYDPILHEVEEVFMPWLKEQASHQLSQGIIARKIVRGLVEAAAGRLQQQREEAQQLLQSQIAQAEAWKAKRDEIAAAMESSESARQQGLGAFLLETLEPAECILKEEAIQALRDELTAAATEKANASFEAAKATASETAKAEAEQQQADRDAAIESAKQAASEAAGEEGLPEGWQPEEGSVPPPVDVEALVAAAVEAVPHPEVVPPTLDDILCAAMDKGMVTKETVVQAMAVNAMGEDAYFRSEPYTREPEPAPPPPPPPPCIGNLALHGAQMGGTVRAQALLEGAYEQALCKVRPARLANNAKNALAPTRLLLQLAVVGTQ